MPQRLIASWLLVISLLVGVLGFAGPAASQAPSEESLKTATELLQAIRAADQMRAIFPMTVQQLKPIIVQKNRAAERDFDALAPAMTDLINARMNELIAAMAGVYAQNFTADEMRQLTAFFRTPVGEKYLDKSPLLVQESMAIGNRFGQQTAGELERRIKDELRKRGHKI
jgi:uncharacterized protein